MYGLAIDASGNKRQGCFRSANWAQHYFCSLKNTHKHDWKATFERREWSQMSGMLLVHKQSSTSLLLLEKWKFQIHTCILRHPALCHTQNKQTTLSHVHISSREMRVVTNVKIASGPQTDPNITSAPWKMEISNTHAFGGILRCNTHQKKTLIDNSYALHPEDIRKQRSRTSDSRAFAYAQWCSISHLQNGR